MLKKIAPIAIAVFMCAGAAACASSSSKGDSGAESAAEVVVKGEFSADSAYEYIARQVEFGPRVPGTAAHDSCAEFLISEMERIGVDSIIVQRGEVTAFDGTVLPICNIISGINVDKARRVLLAAHWDTRPWCDRDHNPEKRKHAVLGANDGGSGVGVIMEIARNLVKNRPDIGVDFIFFDAEDYGDASGFSDVPESWCLGSQYWAEHLIPYSVNNMPVYGILLDMVGGQNARFHYEMFSREMAPTPTMKVWSTAARIGHGDRFIQSLGGAVTDDHVFLCRAGIPTTDIIEMINEETASFPPTWHTDHDNMEHIDKASLRAVGETVLNVLYNEK